VTSLRVLKLDHNPLEYPPREVVAFPGSGSPTLAQGENDQRPNRADEADVMQKWLSGLQRWMAEHVGALGCRSTEERSGSPTDSGSQSPSTAIGHGSTSATQVRAL
jgi:hypothetical protein